VDLARYSLALILCSSPALGQEIKPLCPDRGAIQPCVLDGREVQIEVGLLDRFSDSQGTLLIGDTTVRVGLGQGTEIQVGVSPWLRRDNQVNQSDLRLAVRHQVASGPVSLAVQPMLFVPTGSESVTQGRLVPGVALGGTWDISPETQLYWSPGVFLAQRTTVSGALGVNQTIHGPIGGALEIFLQHQRGEIQASLDYTLTYTIGQNIELDTSANVGLTSKTPGLELVLGITRRF
jgi:hypothetical protein